MVWYFSSGLPLKKLSSFLLALKKKKKKKKKGKEGPDVSSILSASCEQVKAGVCKEGEPVWGLSPELLSWGAWLLEYPWTNTAVAKTILFEFVLCFYGDYLLERVREAEGAHAQ